MFVTRFANEYIIAEIEKSCLSYLKLFEKGKEHFEGYMTYIIEEDSVFPAMAFAFLFKEP